MENNFLEKSLKIHGDKYDYSLVEYKNAHIKVKLICKLHGEFLIKPNNHLNGQGCKKCGIENRIKQQSKKPYIFLEECKNKYGNKYDYSLVEYKNRKTKIKIKCNKCNSIFEKLPYAHLNGQGCRNCYLTQLKKNTKFCIKCNKEKNIKDFYFYKGKYNSSYVYYNKLCKDCEKTFKHEKRKLETLEDKQKRRLYFRNYNNNRRKNDVEFKLKKDISSIIRKSLKIDLKHDSVWNYLPYTTEELKIHLENKFDKNMTWDNHGVYWHIDHIIPQSYFKFESINDENFKKCWSLENLQPLKVEENLIKSSLYNGVRY